MRVLFCKIALMKYYHGVSADDPPYNGGSFVKLNGYGHEEFNFTPIKIDNQQIPFCLGFVETKSTVASVENELHIEKIRECAAYTHAGSVDDVLVIWCATTDKNETSVMGWYQHASVFRHCENIFLPNSNATQYYNVIAQASNCVLLPFAERNRHNWNIPTARATGCGFGQALVWYASEEKALYWIERITKSIFDYSGSNWVHQNTLRS